MDPAAPVVAVVTHVKAGYFDEPDEWVGIAHVLEHMFFKGTARRAPGDLARETQQLGGYLNASTIYDKTVYYTVLPAAPGALERAMDIQADALMNAALDQGELSRELEVVIQEAKRKLDNPGALATETLYKLLFRVHRMRRWRIGTETGLRQLDAGALRAYYASRYAPSRTIIGLAGNLDRREAVALARKIYGGWKVKPGEFEGSPPEPDEREPRIEVLHGDIQRALALIGWRTVAEMHEDAPALDVAAAILGSGRGSWLSRFVRTPGLAAAASSGHYTPTEVGVFDITLQGDADRLDEAVARSLELVARLGADGPDEAELVRVRSLVAMRWARAFETVDGRAAAVCEFEALGGFGLADEIYQRTLAVTADDVRRVADAYLAPPVASAVCYLARGGETRFAAPGAWPPASATGTSAASPVVELPVLGRAGRRVGEDAVHGPVLHHPLKGCDVLVQQKKGSGLVTLALYVPGMHDEEDRDSAGLSCLLARSSLRGAGGLSAEELALAAESMGGSIGAMSGMDGLGWSITVPAAELSRAAQLLRLVALEPTLDPAQVEIERDLQAADAMRVRDDMYRYPVQGALGLAFKGDPYGLPALGTPETLRALDPARVRGWSEAMASRRAVLVAVGDLKPAALGKGAAHLGGWPGNAADRRITVPRFHAGSGAESREKAQTALALAFPGAASNASRRFAVDVLTDFLSGLAGRLFQLLREERALAYTVTAYPWTQRRGGSVVTYIATSPEREAEAREAMLAALRDVAAGQVSEEEVERARNYAAGQVQIARQASASVAGEILSAWVHDLIDELPELPDRLRAVTVADVVREAEEVFGGAHAEFVVRGEKR